MPARTSEELRADSLTVAYEVEMFIDSAKLLVAAEGRRVLSNVAIESFITHCRALIDFLWGTRSEKNGAFNAMKDSDVIACDYTTQWPAERPVKDPKSPKPRNDLAKEVKNRANVLVAHITTARRGVNQPGDESVESWPVPTLSDLVLTEMQRFLDAVSDDVVDTAARRRILKAFDLWRDDSGVEGVVPVQRSSKDSAAMATTPSWMQARTTSRTDT